MADLRETMQNFYRWLGLLNASCCNCCCGEEISLVQIHILYEIRRMGNPSMQQVAETLGMDITTFSKQIKSLVKKGFVEKKAAPGDRRVNLLDLTGQGRSIERKVSEQMSGYLEKIFSRFTGFERETVVRSLDLLNRAIFEEGLCCSGKQVKKLAKCN